MSFYRQGLLWVGTAADGPMRRKLKDYPRILWSGEQEFLYGETKRGSNNLQDVKVAPSFPALQAVDA